MKRNYAKPAIVFESFTLSTNIAASCGDQAELLAADYECGKLFSNGKTVFMTGMFGCTDIQVVPDQDGDGMWGTFCYHIPESKALINS